MEVMPDRIHGEYTRRMTAASVWLQDVIWLDV